MRLTKCTSHVSLNSNWRFIAPCAKNEHEQKTQTTRLGCCIYRYHQAKNEDYTYIRRKTLYSMEQENLLTRITINANICHGKPTIRGLRYPVENMLELLAVGMSYEEILADYPDLVKEDLLACLV